MDIYCDNHSTIKIYSDPVHKQRTKRIEVHMHYIQELVHDRTITLHYCPIEDQIAHIFTKYFTKKSFSFLRSLLGVKAQLSIPISTYFEGGFPIRFSPITSVYYKEFLSFILYMGEFCPCFQGP